MRYIVLDTNVIVSALAFGGKPRSVLHMVRLEQRIAGSRFIQWEVEKVLRNKFNWSTAEIAKECRPVWDNALIVRPHEYLSVIANDPADNHILECALAAKAEYIVSGDRHLLSLRSFETITIVPPTEFLSYHTP